MRLIRSIGLIAFFLCSLFMVATPSRAQNPGGPGDEPRDAPRMSPAEYNHKLQLAQVYEETHDATNAVRVYGELYTLNPNDETVFEGYLRSLVTLKRFEDAEKIVNVRLQTDNRLDIVLLSARIEAWMGKRSDALSVFQKAEQMVNAKDCEALFPIVYAMMDVSYNQDALGLLDEMRKNSSAAGAPHGEDEVCSSQIAGLYLRLGEFDRASKEFITILKAGEGNIGMVEQRLAEYLTDSLSRATVLSALEREIVTADDAANGGPNRANLRLLAWLYGERKDYAKALETIIQLDDLSTQNPWNEGPELLQFADRARSEGALQVAAKAYAEASRRLKENKGQDYYVEQAELGSLKTWEAYYLSKSKHDPVAMKDSIAGLISNYEAFATNGPMNDFALDALLHAGGLAFSELFDLPRATKDLEAAMAHAQNGLTEPVRQAAFRLVDIAYASEDFSLAGSRLRRIEELLGVNHSQGEKETRDHILYERALGQYYQGNFDSCSAMLENVAADAASDYANDAIALAGIVEAGNTPGGLPSLKFFAKGALAEQAHKWADAESDYRAIIDSQLNAPLADNAALRSAAVLVKLGRAEDAIRELDSMQTKLLSSPLLDVAAFREAEIVERDMHDKARAQKLYEDFLVRYPNSNFVNDARDRARKLRGDAF
jgi:tetratricopeptide (TPR) repeat protein